MTVLAAAAPMTNAAFMDQVVAAFGTKPPQHPYLDCAEDAKNLPLLAPLVVAGR
jgi:hypothetical protein